MGDFEFVISDGPSRGTRIAFPGSSFTIGSGADCQLRFEPALVRAKHAEVVTDPNGVMWVRDLTGANLLWVNGEPAPRAQLVPGTFVRLGRLELVVRGLGQARAGPSGTLSTPTPLRQKATAEIDSTARRPTPLRSGVEFTAKRPTPLGPEAEGVAHAVSKSGVKSVMSSGRQPGVMTSEPGAQNLPPGDETLRSTKDEVGGLFPGAVIDGRYQVVSRIAAGGMGEVYKVEHIELGKTFAMKVMLSDLSRDPEFAARFKREAIAASRIGQQNIIDISDFGRTADGRFYFVMEFLEGITLASLVHRQGALPVERVVNIGVQVTRALAAAHAQGIVHRDLKPENIMLLQRPGQADFVKVLDFGVAKVAQGQGQGGHTAIGMVVGTPQYMSPEQAKALQVDARSDIYSLGLILYELLAGRPTFTGETPSILMVKHVTELPPPLVPGPLAEVPPELEGLIFAMLAKDAAERPQTMTQIVEVLDAIWAQAKAGTLGGAPLPMGQATPRPGSTGMASGGFRSPSGGFASTGARQSGGFRAAPGGQPSGPYALQNPPSDTGPVDEPLVPRRSLMPFVALGAVVLLAGGGTIYALTRGEKPQPPPVVVVPPKVDPVPVKPDLPPAVVVARLTAKSEPERAEVYDENDVLLGNTPLTLTRPPGTKVKLTFKLRGYQPSEKNVVVDDNEVIVALEKERKVVTTVAPKKSDGLMDMPAVEDLKPNPFDTPEKKK